MEKGTKIALGIGGTAVAISIIYFGFTDKGQAKWASLMGSTTGNDPLKGRPNKHTAENAESGVKTGADGTNLIPRRAGFGSPFGSNGADGARTLKAGLNYGSNVNLKEIKSQGVVIGWVDKDGVKWTKA